MCKRWSRISQQSYEMYKKAHANEEATLGSANLIVKLKVFN